LGLPFSFRQLSRFSSRTCGWVCSIDWFSGSLTGLQKLSAYAYVGFSSLWWVDCSLRYARLGRLWPSAFNELVFFCSKFMDGLFAGLVAGGLWVWFFVVHSGHFTVNRIISPGTFYSQEI
jgi:hypothetical protein